MATMLNGAAVMDAAFLLIGKFVAETVVPCSVPNAFLNTFSNTSFSPPLAGNESCPQPQTSEHLAAIEIMQLRHIIILQNKIDLVKETQAEEQYGQIVEFVKGRFASLFPAPTCLPSNCPTSHCAFRFLPLRHLRRRRAHCAHLGTAALQH